MRMRMYVITAAALGAAAFSGAALAEEATKGSTAAPAAMTDSQMDAVTAGDAGGIPNANSAGNADYGQTVRANAPYTGDSHPEGNRHN